MKTNAPLLPDGVAESWFHIHCGGEVWISRICRGQDLLKVLDELAPGSYAEDLADQDNWYVLDGKCRSISLPCGEDPDIEVTLIEAPEFERAVNREWKFLSSLRRGNQLTELLAASCEDGIGIIARWTIREDGGWDVTAMDTEGDGGMEPVTDFGEEECIPATPPEEYLAATPQF